MDYKALIEISENRAAMFHTRRDEGGYIHEENCQRALWELLARAEAAEVRCETLRKMVKQYQDSIVPGYRKRAETAEEIASELCDDFTDYVTGGVHNAAPYCANRRPECVNAHGWCDGDNRVCRGFMQKAAVGKKEE